ncbi:MAG: MFS transporter [Candidatus Cryptobacteroides sp.]|nr:MFS transporter [Rikenellaceae bacterium]MDY5746014.1 MFS transporter [Candidatus Cryptobacteroides sp.]
MANVKGEANGFYKLSWLQRIGFGSGDMAQNLIYQTISIWLLFFYTNVYGLKPAVAAVMFLVVRLVDVLWDPIVGTLVDKSNPRWGKYRSWLILGGIPLVGLAILCFWSRFNGSVIYAYITYVAMSMCYTLVNVPYGALNSSLTRDTDEITILTSTRMFMANLGGLVVKSLPMVIAIFAPKVLNPESGKMEAVYNTPESASAWFVTMTIFALAGLVLLIFCFSQTKERVVMDEKESANVKVSDLWMEFVRNKPLRVLAFFFITAFAMMSVSNAADSYFMTSTIHANAFMTTVFMWLGTIPAFIFMPLVPAIKKKIGKKGMFYLFLGTAIVGMLLMYIFVSIPALKSQFWLLCVAQFIKSTGIITATGYMWALVPEVVSYGEYTSGRRIAGIVNALTGIFFKAGMALGGVVPGLVLAWVGYNASNVEQTPLAQQGILWLVCVIPAILLLLAMFIISKYELSDEKMDEINKAIEERSNKN